MPRSLEHVLGEVRRFAGLEEEQLALLAGCARNVRFRAGEQLFREGDMADTFWVVRRGSVALEAFDAARGTLQIETIAAGELLGWSWLFPPYRWHFDARAVSDIRATAFDGACLRQKCEDDPRLGYVLMGLFAQVLIERLQSTRLRLLDIYGDGDAR
jgi:CRP-like cAMP-binding protein